MKLVFACRKVGVVRDAALSGRCPVALESLHPVPEAQPLRRRESQRRVLNLELAFARRQIERRREGNRWTTRDCLLDDDRQAIWTLRFVGHDDDGAFRSGQPDLAGRRDHSSRLDAASQSVRVEPLSGVVQPHRHVPGRMRRRDSRSRRATETTPLGPLSHRLPTSIFADEMNLLLGRPCSTVNCANRPDFNRNNPAPCVPIQSPRSESW